MKQSMRTPFILLTLLLLTALLFTGCDALIDNGMHRAECEAYLDAMLAGDFKAAHAITPAINEEEHRAYFEENCKILEGATSYTLTQTGWNIHTTNGVTTKTASYQIVTDNGITCQFTLNTVEGYEGIANIGFRDSTEFIESTLWVETADAISVLISLPLVAFYIWMIVDSIRRKMPKKVWWIILTLLTVNFTFILGSNTFNSRFMVSILDTFISVEAIVPNETITLDFSLPLGALIYFFLRKKISAKYAARQVQIAPADTVAPLTVADLTQAEDAPAEEEKKENE